MFYATKVICKEHKSILLGHFKEHKDALEFLYSKLSTFSEDHQILIEKNEDVNIIKVYQKTSNIFIGYSKDLIEVWQIQEFPKSEI